MQLKEEPILVISIIGATITRLLAVLFSTYLILWIQKFYEEDSSLYIGINDKDRPKQIYMEIMLMSVGVAFILFPIFGKICDTVDPGKIIPVAFFFRFITTIFFYNLKSPESNWAYCVCMLMIVSTVVESISVDTIFN